MALTFTFLGTGAPPVSLRRAGPSHLVEGDGRKILIDCGSGVAQRLIASGHKGAEIDALIVTHEHSDHLVDFYQLVVSSWHQGRDRPWRVLAPKPALLNMQGQYEAFRRERELRITFEKRPSAIGLEVQFEELRSGMIPGFGGLAVEGFLVDHAPVEPAFGLKFSHAGTSAVFSGDTRMTPSLEQAAQGADLLISEIFVTREMPVTPGVRTLASITAVASYHITPPEAAALATRAKVGLLALTHVVPPAAETAALVREVRNGGYSGPLVVGEDTMAIDVGERLIRWNGAAIGY